MDQHLNILVQSSDYYAPFAGVMLTSLFENNRDIDCITVYLMTSDMSEKNRERFQILAEQYQRTVKLLDAAKLDALLETEGVPQYNGSYASYYKIFALSLIDDDIDRLVYLDSDMVINGSLSYFVDVDLDNMVVGMCTDSMLGKYTQMLKLRSANYYNTGVIIFDAKRWISEGWMDKVIHHITSVCASYPVVDQDILNIVLCGKIKMMPLTYNFSSGALWYGDYKFFTAAHGLKDYYSEYEFMQAQQNPIILHCFGTFGTRPWHEGEHAAKEVWNKYMMRSPWNDYIYQKANVSLMNKIQRFLFKYTPHSFFAAVHKSCWYFVMRQQIKKLSIQ